MDYEVKALRRSGGIAALTLEAADESDAVLQAERQGYAVLSVRPRRAFGWPHVSRARFPLALFSQELLALLGAGLGLVEALETLAEKEHRPEAKKLLTCVLAQLYAGHSLSAALENFPMVFPPLYVATVRASERTGDVTEALARYVAYEAQVDLLRKKIVSASIYPVLLMLVGGLVMLFLMGYVVPKFGGIYENSGRDLPWLSQLLLGWGKLLNAHGAAVVAAAVACAAAGVYVLLRPGVRQRAVAIAWRFPAAGERMRVYQLARFYRTVGMLLKGGIPALQAAQMVAGLLQPALRARLYEACAQIRAGRALSQALYDAGLTTPVAVRMLRVGERSGQMGEMTERIAAFYDDEISRWVDWFSRLFEPLLMTLIGLMIGVIVLLMYLPIFELAGNIQ